MNKWCCYRLDCGGNFIKS